MFATPAALIAHFRTQRGDKTAPYFWSEPELYAYMTQAEQLIAQRTLCIQDTTSAACLYDVAEGQAEVVLDPSIVRIREARWLQGNGEYRLSIQSLDAMVGDGARIFTQAGRPNTMMTGSQTNGVRLYPIPQDEGQLAIAIYRIPLNPLSATASFEIPFQYRGALYEWMKHQALSKDDADTFDPRGAGEALGAFERLLDTYTTNESHRRGAPQGGGIRYGGL